MSRARRFRLKADQCWEVADNAQLPQTKVIFTNLALSYGRLAGHEESLEAAIQRCNANFIRRESVREAAQRPRERQQSLPNQTATAAKSEGSKHSVARLLADAGAAYNFLCEAVETTGYREWLPWRPASIAPREARPPVR
jgi:hypothetical protein